LIDITNAYSPIVLGNKTCSASGPETNLGDPVNAINPAVASSPTVRPQVIP
jgi:hypothetical protein